MGKRLTLDNMDHLRNEVLEIIGRIRIPKFEVAQRIVCGSPGCGCCSGCQDNDDNNNNNINNIINTDSCYAREGEVLNDTLNAILSPSSSSSGCAGGGRSNINNSSSSSIESEEYRQQFWHFRSIHNKRKSQ